MKKGTSNPFEVFARKIVEKRHLVMLIFFFALIFTLFSVTWVKVEDDIVNYLDEDGKTRKGIEIMDKEFITFATAQVMISNISYNHGEKIAGTIREVHGVSSLVFENSPNHYKDGSALMVVLFNGEEDSELSLNAMEEIRNLVEPYDSSIATSIGVNMASQLGKDMIIIGILGVLVGILVLMFSSNSYAEILVLLITFGVAALLNMGTNFILSKVSFISHSVAVVLQLALAIDYSIIMCHRFTEERVDLGAEDAAVVALSKAIPEIASSSLTTVGGLAAMGFMRFGIGLDLSLVMIKAILFSMISVFTLMPGLLIIFSRAIDRTKHRSFVPSVAFIGRFSIRTRNIMPPIFIVLLIASFIFSNKCPFLFSLDEIRPHRLSQSQKEEDRIGEVFGRNNIIALMVASGDFKKEKKLLEELSADESIDVAVGLANTEAMGGYMLTDLLSPRQFSELVDVDYEEAVLLYSAYAVSDEDYAKIVGGVAGYSVPLIDMIEFLYSQLEDGIISLEDELVEELEGFGGQLKNARLQMEGKNYSRLLLYSNLPIESKETFDFVEKIYKKVGKYYDGGDVYLIGETTNAQELASTFDMDNMIISILSVVFVIIVLMFTFKSFGLAILLIAVIQASIWINFSFPYLRDQGLYFLGFLVVSSIQMGANIDYAIVITSRYMGLKNRMDRKEAIAKALDQAFPTVITSGSILAIAGYLIGFISTDGATSILGTYIGQGTIISIILVLFVLPQILYLGDWIIEKTSFAFNIPMPIQVSREKLHLDGRVQGYVKGEIDALVEGTIIGEIRSIREKDDNSNSCDEGEEDSYEKI